MLRCFAKHIGLVSLALLWAGLAFAQPSGLSDDKLWMKADRALEQGDFFGAREGYQELEKRDASDEELLFKIGLCHYQIRRDRHLAKAYFEKVRPHRFVEASYYLGRLAHLDERYDEAISHFLNYQAEKGFKERSEKEISDQIQKARVAMRMPQNENPDVVVRNLGPEINTAFPEYAPLLSPHENKLIFTSRRENALRPNKDAFGDYFENIFQSDLKDGVWSTPQPLDSNVNTALHDAATGLSADGTHLLIFRTSADLSTGNIYESVQENDGWSHPEMLGAIINSEDGAETSACYAPGGQLMFFSSTRPGGFGGKDLYVVKKLPNNQWGVPYNLGPSINTEYNEDAPFVHPSGTVLFFSSEGHHNMGGYDVFQSSFDEVGYFSEPINLGTPVNTNDDDIFFVLNADATVGYLSSERSDGLGGQDLYAAYFDPAATLLQVFNVVIVNETAELLTNVEMTLYNEGSKKLFGEYRPSEHNGKMVVISEAHRRFKVTIEAEGYEPLHTEIVLSNERNYSFTLTRTAE